MGKAVRQKKKKPLILEKIPCGKNSQTVQLLTGMPVVARVNNNFAGVFNNEHFVIKHTTATEITVNDGERKIAVPQADFQRTFYVAHAMMDRIAHPKKKTPLILEKIPIRQELPDGAAADGHARDRPSQQQVRRHL